MRIAPGIHRIRRGQINVYLIEEAGEVTIVDAGLRRSLSPLNADRELARVSLGRLDSVGAGLVLPGHGEPWTGGVAAAVAEGRSRP